ncbi:MFS transporter [Pseudactinotalea sp.]|uniref:MFS transporter n=1 Tax=Pseudactinotalea sp. TaxID=1926260 RepID=UPI003B3A5E29
MTDLSPARVRLALLALALGGFGIGTTEFVAMGLLPEFASDLLPEVWASDSELATASAGHLISAYALGVVVGAPTIATVAARLPRRALLLGLAVAFTIATVASALSPTHEVALVARFVAGLPHGAYFGVASLVAASLMGPGKRGQGVAFVMAGLTVANVIGVPLITMLGQRQGWQVAYLAVAGIFAATAISIALVVPAQPGDAGATVRRELTAMRRGQVWLALAIGSLGFGGFFAVYSYISPLATEVGDIPTAAVPWVLATMGVGMTVGNLLGGRLADRGSLRGMLIGFVLFIAALGLLGVISGSPVGLFVGIFAVGTTACLTTPSIQTRLMDVAGESQTLAAALNHAALNIGNSLGAFLGAMVIAAGLGFVAPTWLGLGIAVLGLGIVLSARAVQVRTDRQRPTAVSTPAVTAG